MYKTFVWAHEMRVIIKNKLDSPFSCFFFLLFFFFSFYPMVELKLKNLPSIQTYFLFYFIIY